MIDNYYYIKTAGKIFGILILLLLIPVLVFEVIILHGIVDYSFPGVISGNLVNISEKQLLNSGFTPIPGMQRYRQLEKEEILLIGNDHIPVQILIRFDQPLDNMEFFLQPVSISWHYPTRSDSAIFAALNLIADPVRPDLTGFMTAVKIQQMNDSLIAVNPEDIFAYDLTGKRYFFCYQNDPRVGISEIRTEIFCGKLYLMFKYYVCRFYEFLPENFTPSWYRMFSKM